MNRIPSAALSVFAGVLCAANCFSASGSGIDIPATAAPKLSLDEIRQVNQELYTTLESFVCAESIQRFKGHSNGDNARQIDTVRAKVSFENGTEQYAEIRQNERQRASISSLSGAWSVGEFGTLLGQTEALLRTAPATFRAYDDLEGSPVALYVFEVSEESSPWDLVVGSEHVRVPFRTDLWISRETGQVLKMERTSTGIPARMGISEIRWGVTLQPVRINEKTWLLPKTGSYEVSYEQSDRKEWNRMTFSDYHRYGSEVALRFQ